MQHETAVPVHETRDRICTYEAEGICVLEDDRFIKTDPAFLSWVLSTEEYEVNYFYPGFDLFTLADESRFILNYKWANYHTDHQGEYDPPNVTARVWVREGDNITPLMQCMDRYNVAMHEVLHFVADKHIHFINDPVSDPHAHNVPNLFRQWAILSKVSVDLTVEGRMYNMIWRRCQEQIERENNGP